MRRLLFILLTVYFFFIVESVWLESISRHFKPNFLILVIIFFNLVRGVRYSLFAAFVAGILKDCYSVNPFGLHLLVFVLCAYLTTIIKGYVYHPGSNFHSLLIVFIMSLLYVLIRYVFNLMDTSLMDHSFSLRMVWTEISANLIVTLLVFGKLRECASRYFV